MTDHHRSELVVDALDTAHGRAGLEPGCVIHSDRGSECTSTQFRDRIREMGLRQSCGRTGSRFDNAAAESFWALLKEEIGTPHLARHGETSVSPSPSSQGTEVRATRLRAVSSVLIHRHDVRCDVQHQERRRHVGRVVLHLDGRELVGA